MGKFKFVFGATVLFIALLLPFSNVLSQEVGSGGVGGRPAFPREDNERSKSIFIHEISPGQTVQEGVNVINNSSETKKIFVYATDSVVASGGALSCAQKVDQPQDVGSWITLEKNEVEVKSAETLLVPFTMSAPLDAEVGEHNGCIVIEENKPTEAKEGIGLNFRTAIRVAALIPGEINKNLEAESLTVKVTDSDVVITPKIKNTGNVSVDAEIITELRYLWGSLASETGGNYPVLAKQTAEWNFTHKKPFLGGWYKVKAITSYDKSSQTYIGDSAENVEKLYFPDKLVFVMPHPVMLIILALLIVTLSILIVKLLSRKKANKEISTKWQLFDIEKGDTIQSLAKEHGASWKQIAKVNKLKPPYDLVAGNKIKLPPKK